MFESTNVLMMSFYMITAKGHSGVEDLWVLVYWFHPKIHPCPGPLSNKPWLSPSQCRSLPSDAYTAIVLCSIKHHARHDLPL